MGKEAGDTLFLDQDTHAHSVGVRFFSTLAREYLFQRKDNFIGIVEDPLSGIIPCSLGLLADRYEAGCLLNEKT